MKTSQTSGMPSTHGWRLNEELTLDNLAALISVPVLQQAQDAFSSALHIPILFVTTDGTPITATSGIEMFCAQFTRKLEPKRPCTECGRNKCGTCETETFGVFQCPFGLTDVALPITVEGKTVGYLLTCQTTTTQGAPQVVQAARASGMSPSAAISYASRLPVETPERLSEVAKGLSALAEIVSQLAAASRKSRQAEITDPLTGIANRTWFWNVLSREIELANMHNYPVSVMLVDLDGFKKINDTFGHETGDRVLQTVAQILTREIRTSDLVARYGSDSFLVLLKCTDPGGADIVAWRLKNKISACKVTSHGQKVPVSASVAHVTYPLCAASDPDSLYKELWKTLRSNTESEQPFVLPKAA